MKLTKESFVFVFVVACVLALPSAAMAQREVNWQVNAQKFPSDVSIFTDVMENQVSYVNSLTSADFAVSVDEFAGDMGGWILNADQATMRGGATGTQVLIMIDRSRSYTKEFDRAKKMAKAIAQGLRPGVDEVGVAVFPSGGGYSESKLLQNFTSNAAIAVKAVHNVKLMPDGDETGGRFCNALSEGIKYFPQGVHNKYRVIIFLTGGADKAEGKGNCVQESYAAGKVPFYSMIFKLDRKYDDKRNSHKIENATHDLAVNTGGRSIFRRSDSEMAHFITSQLWNRVKSQYYLQVSFPCYRPAPYYEHTSILKVQGRDADAIKYQAASVPPPTPSVTALYPPQATRQQVDDGMDLTIDGTGFCGAANQVKAYVGGRQVAIKSQSPYRLVTSLNKNIEAGKVKVGNRYGETGESAEKFQIIKPPKGAEASSTLTYLIIGGVGLVVLAVIIVALRSRKAKVPMGAAPKASSVAPPSQVPGSIPGGAPKTVAVGAVSTAWIVKPDGTKIDLSPGPNLVGREVTCRIKLEVQGVSREHAKIELDPATNTVWVEDLGSTNGTFWGPEGVLEHQIQRLTERRQFVSGESVWIGGQKLAVFVKDASGAQEG